MSPLNVGIIGCGNICDIYLQTLSQADETTVLATADLIPERAQAAADRHFVPRAMTVSELLATPEIDIVVNLTIPGAHMEVARQALRAGKHVYSEKPMTLSTADATELIELAASSGLLLAGAPDTVLGAGIQTCRRLVDYGAIGIPVAASAAMLCAGHESWHPSPAFYYQKGGGPMFDMGPYYLTALTEILGPMRRVASSTQIPRATRTITSQPLEGTQIEVETPTHIASIIDFISGVIATVTMSFDVVAHSLPCLEVYGTEGTLHAPDPNGFGGPVLLRRQGSTEWEEQPLEFGYERNSRGLGVIDMVWALRSGGVPRLSGGRCRHVIEAMEASLTSSELGTSVGLTSTMTRGAPMPALTGAPI